MSEKETLDINFPNLSPRAIKIEMKFHLTSTLNSKVLWEVVKMR